ncbi:MAG: ABC transporter permease, partial [Clostridia bacterium]|nr:ABC transporter permease [Clostridia bacterium]
IEGGVGTERRFWTLLQDSSLLLVVGLALIPAFKMKFWNLGGNGQVLIGALATFAVMKFLGGVIPDGVVWILMLLASVIAGAIWAVIPALFKAFFNTNESLFTLMMNYIAVVLVEYFEFQWKTGASNRIDPFPLANLPVIGDNKYLLTIFVALIMTVFLAIYLRFSKHGYEISVVGESQNTAKYIGINVKKVIIRTLILSGAMCGLVGLLLAGGINYTISPDTAQNMGFTGIMVAWLAKFNPFLMIISAFGIQFLTKGMGRVQKQFGITNDAVSSIMIGIIYFFVIACEFFISYKINFNFKNKDKTKVSDGGKK